MSLQDDVVKAIQIRNNHPVRKDFDEDTLKFLSGLFLWRRPEKFFNEVNEARITSGTIAITQGRRCFRFVFDNGYVWWASTKKLAPNIYKRCKELVPLVKNENRNKEQ